MCSEGCGMGMAGGWGLSDPSPGVIRSPATFSLAGVEVEMRSGRHSNLGNQMAHVLALQRSKFPVFF